MCWLWLMYRKVFTYSWFINKRKRNSSMFSSGSNCLSPPPFSDLVLDMCIAIAISLLMILICAMATYGAYKVSGCGEVSARPFCRLLHQSSAFQPSSCFDPLIECLRAS